jgi:thiol-disulfide isomerase/thioredoxin
MNRYTKRNRGRNTQKQNKSGVVTIGLIYANWCGHCQSLKPEWKKMKYNIMRTPSYKKGGYKFIEIEDADKTKDNKINNINSRLRGGDTLAANGYPTIFKVEGGSLKYFEGGRTAGELQSWFLNSKQEDKEAPPRNVHSIFNRIFGGKTKKNKTLNNKKKD